MILLLFLITLVVIYYSVDFIFKTTLMTPCHYCSIFQYY